MKPVRYVLSPEADADIGQILRYVAGRGGTSAALRVADRLDAAMARLARLPGLGHRREDLTPADVWFYRVYAYLIVYRRARPLQVVRVIHASRDVAALLGLDEPA